MMSYVDKNMFALINDKKVIYDFCSKQKEAYPDITKKTYLGEGTIFSINNVQQSGNNVYHFWINS